MASPGLTRRELLLQGATGLLVAGCPRGRPAGDHPAFGAPVPGGSTLSRTIVGGGEAYARLAYGAGEPHLLRQDLGVSAAPERTRRRASLLYLAQLSDTHVLDAESPARVEYAAAVQLGDSYVAKAAFRPQEALTAYVLDAMARPGRSSGDDVWRHSPAMPPADAAAGFGLSGAMPRK